MKVGKMKKIFPQKTELTQYQQCLMVPMSLMMSSLPYPMGQSPAKLTTFDICKDPPTWVLTLLMWTAGTELQLHNQDRQEVRCFPSALVSHYWCRYNNQQSTIQPSILCSLRHLLKLLPKNKFWIFDFLICTICVCGSKHVKKWVNNKTWTSGFVSLSGPGESLPLQKLPVVSVLLCSVAPVSGPIATAQTGSQSLSSESELLLHLTVTADIYHTCRWRWMGRITFTYLKLRQTE